MIVHSALFITRSKTAIVFEPIDQPLHALPEPIEGTIKRASAAFILLPRDGDTDTVASQVLPNLPTTVCFVTHQTTRPAFGAPAPSPFHRSACHQGFEGHRFVPLPRGEDQRHQLAPAFRADMDFRTEAALTATERFGLGVPAVGPSRVLVCSDYRAIHIMDIPVQVRCGIRTLLDRGKEASPEASFLPAIKTARHGAPRTIPLWQITPGGAGADNPQDAVEDAAVVSGWATCMRFLWGKQGL
jgi:hypothetical protein